MERQSERSTNSTLILQIISINNPIAQWTKFHKYPVYHAETPHPFITLPLPYVWASILYFLYIFCNLWDLARKSHTLLHIYRMHVHIR